MSPSFAAYQKESNEMSIEYLKWHSNSDKEAYHFAYNRANPVLKKHWNKKKSEYKWSPTDEKKLFSVFFFAWTQEERAVREAMKGCFSKQTLNVHDAVYSQQFIPSLTLEKTIKDNLDLTIGIESDVVEAVCRNKDGEITGVVTSFDPRTINQALGCNNEREIDPVQ